MKKQIYTFLILLSVMMARAASPIPPIINDQKSNSLLEATTVTAEEKLIDATKGLKEAASISKNAQGALNNIEATLKVIEQVSSAVTVGYEILQITKEIKQTVNLLKELKSIKDVDKAYLIHVYHQIKNISVAIQSFISKNIKANDYERTQLIKINREKLDDIRIKLQILLTYYKRIQRQIKEIRAKADFLNEIW